MRITIEHEKSEDRPPKWKSPSEKPEPAPAEYNENTPGWPWDL